MATRQEMRGWIGDISEERFDKILAEMVESGEMEINNGLYYISEKGLFEFVYGKYQYFDYDGKGEVTDVRDHKKSFQNNGNIKK